VANNGDPSLAKAATGSCRPATGLSTISTQTL